MVRNRRSLRMGIALAATAMWSLACIGVSSDPRGRFEIVTYTVEPAGGKAQTVSDAGAIQLGNLLTCDTGWFEGEGGSEGCDIDRNSADAMTLLAWEWVGDGLVSVYSPEPVFFDLPEWNGDRKSWTGPLPLGNLSCTLTREGQDPLVLKGRNCAGPGGSFDVELVMDR